MEMYIAANQGDRDPYWTEPWPSAVCAAQELFSNPSLLSLHPSSSQQQSTTTTTTKSTAICELGCGLGLLGIAAALSGPYSVTLLDREPLALQCCLINALINGVGISGAAQEISSSSILQYLTAKERSKIEQHMHRNNNNQTPLSTTRVGLVDVDILDWSAPVTPRHQGTYDTVLLSDVLYEKYSVEPVANIVPRLLKSNDGSDGLALFLADPPNRARINRERFLELLQNGGNGNNEFVLSEVEEKVVMFEGEEKEVMLIMIKRMSRFGDTIGVKRL
jgi:ETFB lysine methyltransferase